MEGEEVGSRAWGDNERAVGFFGPRGIGRIGVRLLQSCINLAFAFLVCAESAPRMDDFVWAWACVCC